MIVLSDSEDEEPRATSRAAAKQARNYRPRSAQAAGAAWPTVRSMTAGQQGGLASCGVVDLTGLDDFGRGSISGGQGSRHSPAAGHAQAAAVRPAAVPAPPQLEQQPPLLERLGLKDPELPAHWQVCGVAQARRPGCALGSCAVGHPICLLCEWPSPAQVLHMERIGPLFTQLPFQMPCSPDCQLSEEVLRGELVLVDLPLPGAALPQDQVRGGMMEQGVSRRCCVRKLAAVLRWTAGRLCW